MDGVQFSTGQNAEPTVQHGTGELRRHDETKHANLGALVCKLSCPKDININTSSLSNKSLEKLQLSHWYGSKPAIFTHL